MSRANSKFPFVFVIFINLTQNQTRHTLTQSNWGCVFAIVRPNFQYFQEISNRTH